MELLKHTTVGQLSPREKGTICLDHTISVSEALQVLSQYGILSAPVFNTETKMCLGSLDVLDLMTFVLTGDKHRRKEKFKLPIYNAIDASRINPFIPVLQTESLATVIDNFLAEGIHRVPIVDIQNNIVSILAQYDVAWFVLKQMQTNTQLANLGVKTLGQLELVPGIVVSVRNSVTLEQAFQYIKGNDINGIAVVDEHGVLVGNLSASDFKGITENNFIELERKVGDYLKNQTLITCNRNTTLYEAVAKMVEFVVHRIYIIDDLLAPVGVVTLTTLMKLLKEHILHA